VPCGSTSIGGVQFALFEGYPAGALADLTWVKKALLSMTSIYKICTATEWRDAERAGSYRGSTVDLKDGFIHFSTGGQAAETAAKHFAGQRDLVLVTVDSDALDERLKWEPSRGGALFPHLYGALDLKAVRKVEPLPLDASGRHVFPK
jgi:uncharacterized protein (DUF952 family)